MSVRQEPERLFFTADLHLYHDNLRNPDKIGERTQFSTWMEMNEVIRDQHNKVCDQDSIIYNLGDAVLLPKHSNSEPFDETTVLSFLKTFKGRILYMQGNHERSSATIRRAWASDLPQLHQIAVKDDQAHEGVQHVILCHYALRVWNLSHYGSFHLHGHSHGKLRDDNGKLLIEHPVNKSMDVGVDTHPEFQPYSWFAVREKLNSHPANLLKR